MCQKSRLALMILNFKIGTTLGPMKRLGQLELYKAPIYEALELCVVKGIVHIKYYYF